MKIEDIENNLILQANSLNSVLERKIKEVENMDVRDILIKNVDNSSSSIKQELKKKFEHLDIEIQKIAAEHLASQLGIRVNMEDKNRMEQAKKISETIRVAFEALFLNSHISHETSITIHAAPE